MPRSHFGKGAIAADGTANELPATFRVLYVTNASTDPLFIPGNNQAEAAQEADRSHDNPDNGDVSERLANCRSLVGLDTGDANIGVAVQPGTLANW